MIYRLKKVAGEGLFTPDQHAIQLGELRVDSIAFEEARHLGEWQSAAALVRGEFLEGLSYPDCPALEDWISARRLYFENQFVDVVEGLMAQRHFSHAAAIVPVLLETYPHNPQFRAQQIRLVNATAGPDAARTALERLPPDIKPSTAGILEGVQEWTPVAGQPFVGRVEILREIEAQLIDGNQQVFLLSGEAGIGKSSVATRFARIRALRGNVVLTAEAHETEQYIPLGVLDQLLAGLPNRVAQANEAKPWWQAVARVFFSEGTLPTGDVLGERRLFESIRRLFNELSAKGPVLLIIDDIDVADAASLSVITHVLSKEGTDTIRVLGTTRTPVPQRTNTFLQAHAGIGANLGPMDSSEVSRWVRAVGGDEYVPHIPHILERTGGNPLLISSVLEAPLGPVESIPTSVVTYFSPKLQALGPAANRLITAMAVVGTAVAEGPLMEVADLEEDQLAAALAELSSQGLIARQGGTVKLRHGLLGEVVLAGTPKPDEMRIHGKVAREWDQGKLQGAVVAAISHDLAGNDQAAYQAAMKAAEACRVLHAEEEQLFFLKIAIANSPSVPAETSARLSLSASLLRLGRLKEAAEVIPSIGPMSQPALAERAELLRIRIRIAEATTADAAELWQTSRGLLTCDDSNRVELAHTLTELASLAHDLGLDALAIEIAVETQEVVNALENPLLRSSLSFRLIPLAKISGGGEGAVAQLDSLPEPELADAEHRCRFVMMHGVLDVANGRLNSAKDHLAEAAYLAERNGLYELLFAIYNNLGVALLEQGLYEEAERNVVIALEHVAEDGLFFNLASDNLVLIDFERGDWSAAFDRARKAVFGRSTTGRRSSIQNHGMMGLCYLKLGNLKGAKQSYREVQLLAPESGLAGSDLSYVDVLKARILTVEGDPRTAYEYLEEASERYRHRLSISRWRVMVEAARIRSVVGVEAPYLDELLAELEPSGAAPLLERARRLQRRAGRSS